MDAGSNSMKKRCHGSNREHFDGGSQPPYPLSFIDSRSLRRRKRSAHKLQRCRVKHLATIFMAFICFLLCDTNRRSQNGRNKNKLVYEKEGLARTAVRRLDNTVSADKQNSWRGANGNVKFVGGGRGNISAVVSSRVSGDTKHNILEELHVVDSNHLLIPDSRIRIQEIDLTELNDARRKIRGSQERSKADQQIVPFVYMVHKRVDYFKQSIDSLRESDFPRSRVPLVISHDGHVPEMIFYVESLKADFNLVQLFHPFACHDHPHTFPGDDPSLNVGYEGDQYGNPRSKWTTCAKHHWAWMMRTVWDMDFGFIMNVDAIFFTEEDYVVAPNIYNTIVTGLNLAQGPDFFGITLDITNGGIDKEETKEDGWIEGRFRTGPMTITRSSWDSIRAARKRFCTFDEYNWDWSLVEIMSMGKKSIPRRVLSPSVKQVYHIGAAGMHFASSGGNNTEKLSKVSDQKHEADFHFHYFQGKDIVPRKQGQVPLALGGGSGGWGHPRDHQHCLKLLG